MIGYGHLDESQGLFTKEGRARREFLENVRFAVFGGIIAAGAEVKAATPKPTKGSELGVAPAPFKIHANAQEDILTRMQHDLLKGLSTLVAYAGDAVFNSTVRTDYPAAMPREGDINEGPRVNLTVSADAERAQGLASQRQIFLTLFCYRQRRRFGRANQALCSALYRIISPFLKNESTGAKA